MLGQGDSTYEMRTAARTIAARAIPKRRVCMVVNPNPLRMRAENCRVYVSRELHFFFISFDFELTVV